jgi:glycosyltransferase involved in cell wall biosynthesis
MEQVRIAVFTMTRDRLEFSQHCFETLWAKAGEPFDWFVMDNGSTDGTVQWLEAMRPKFKQVVYLPRNIGISQAANLALTLIRLGGPYDLVIKFDNDCEVITPNILPQIVECFSAAKEKFILSPRVEGINRQPVRGGQIKLGRHPIGVTGHVGGLFCVAPGYFYKTYQYPLTLPLASGDDSYFCGVHAKRGVTIGYIEDVVVKHYMTTDGQAKKYPEYFKRKFQEEK